MTERKRICIVTTGHLSTNPRVVKEACALQEAGCRITIVCGDYIPGASALDRKIARADWTLRQVPFGGRVAARPVHMRQRAGQAVARAIVKAGLTNTNIVAAANHPALADISAATCEAPADLYIAHYVAALPAAVKAAQLHGARYAFDAEDFHLGDLPDRREHSFDKALIRSIEGRWLTGAAYVTAASPLIARAYVETYGISEPTIVLNVFPRTYAPPAPTPRGTAVPGPSLYWFSQTIGPGRGLETAVEAVGLAQAKPHLHLRGTPAAGYRDCLRKFAASQGVTDRLHFHEPLPPAELERAGAMFDVAYVGETCETTNRAICLTNKLFSALTSGLPIVASAVPAHNEIAPRLEGAMSLFQVGDAHGLAAQLDGLLCNPGRLATARARAWSLGQSTFSWETEAPRFVERVRGALLATHREPVPSRCTISRLDEPASTA
ncbi:MAG: glycosyltransferase [Hyphomonadaceae bacterium]|nr:glycosyltransferase [Hyphomonadaceae bacterium]MBY0565131.1 glycosyltransferase [Hyphomonadaceae bacterium]